MNLCNSVSYHLRGKSILSEVSWSTVSSINFVIGPNGSGKSTLLSLLGGELGEKCDKLSGATLLPTNPWADGDLLVRELANIFLGNKDITKAESFVSLDVLEFLDLELSRLSSGERQRVWLACVLAKSAKFVLLDEPLSFLDIQYQNILAKLIQNQAGPKRIFVIANHDLMWMRGFASSETLILNKGQKADSGETLAILKSAAFEKVFNVKASEFFAR
jgi:iron complex transport system ATP-binding protein